MSNEYTPEPGTWRLISPSGVEHTGASPMKALQSEVWDRVPADVAMSRIMASLAPSIEDAQELDAHIVTVKRYAEAVAGWQSTGLVPDGVVESRLAEVLASARKLMGLPCQE